MYRIPGACIRIAFVPLGTSSHSQEFVDAGKTQEAHEAVLLAAKILAASAVQMIMEPQLFCGQIGQFLKSFLYLNQMKSKKRAKKY